MVHLIVLLVFLVLLVLVGHALDELLDLVVLLCVVVHVFSLGVSVSVAVTRSPELLPGGLRERLVRRWLCDYLNDARVRSLLLRVCGAFCFDAKLLEVIICKLVDLLLFLFVWPSPVPRPFGLQCLDRQLAAICVLLFDLFFHCVAAVALSILSDDLVLLELPDQILLLDQ